MAAPVGTSTTDTPAAARRSALYAAVMGLAGLAVLLQGLWAALFIRESGGYQDNWVTVHAHGAEVAIGLALIGTIIAFVRLRFRRDVLIGSVVFTLLLVLETFLGGMVADDHSVGAQVVHIPLALALMGLAVWLPLRASLGRR
jgi:cell division protein FtsW (lipid II flippase)